MILFGLILSSRLGWFQLSHIGKAIVTVLSFDKNKQKTKRASGGITPFQALSTALGGSIGTANIAGVAGAIAIGGAGAIFWMWIAALVGMGVKYAEIVLAIKYRVRNGGAWQGGAMHYIKNGLTKRGGLCRLISKPLAFMFALFGMLSSLIGTTLVQSNTIAMSALDSIRTFSPMVSEWSVRTIVGIVTAILVGMVIIGGVSRIGKASEIIVPFMALGYIVVCIVVLVQFRNNIGTAFASIFSGAFGAKQAFGGTVGFGIVSALRTGVARGVYSNEAGIGSAPMAHACVGTNDPVRQGMYGIFEVFADTIIMCTLTALVVLSSGIAIPFGDATASGTEIAHRAFSTVMPGRTAGIFLAVSMLLFAFTSILGWSVYGIQCASYIFGEKSKLPFRIVFTALVAVGALTSVKTVWKLGETLNYLMAIPNIVAVAVLSGEVKRMTTEYLRFTKKR